MKHLVCDDIFVIASPHESGGPAMSPAGFGMIAAGPKHPIPARMTTIFAGHCDVKGV